jgi:hypothetical protein
MSFEHRTGDPAGSGAPAADGSIWLDLLSMGPPQCGHRPAADPEAAKLSSTLRKQPPQTTRTEGFIIRPSLAHRTAHLVKLAIECA